MAKNPANDQYNTINYNPFALSLSNAIIMNTKTATTPIHFIGHALKTFVSKLTQNPDQYYIKHYSKIKRRYRHNETIW